MSRKKVIKPRVRSKPESVWYLLPESKSIVKIDKKLLYACPQNRTPYNYFVITLYE